MPHLVTCLHKKQEKTEKINDGGNPLSKGNQDNNDHVISWTEHARSGMFIDFGCLYIYTCAKSCWNDASDVICTEVVAMQPDPETSILS